MNAVRYDPIGTIHTPFKSPEDVPLQPKLSKGIKGSVELQPGYVDGLVDLEQFSHIVLIYHFHLSSDFKLSVKPSHSDSVHGVFSTRSPDRPNPIGLSVVKLESIDGRILSISNVDIVNNTPLLDIKPFVPSLARQYGATLGWLSAVFDGK